MVPHVQIELSLLTEDLGTSLMRACIAVLSLSLVLNLHVEPEMVPSSESLATLHAMVLLDPLRSRAPLSDLVLGTTGF
jgi:hypothetical protein